jgi:hypothetical protein
MLALVRAALYGVKPSSANSNAGAAPAKLNGKAFGVVSIPSGAARPAANTP